ncbi:MAG TPA: hypothetical protein VF267_01135, partial [Gammaproteobacteria bacterium]
MGKKFVTAGLFLVTCTASLPLHAAVEGAFQLTRLDEESWSANYCYATPVDAIRFERPFKGLRENSWSVEDKAFVLTFTDDTAELRRTDGGDFRCATVMLETYTVMPEKDYYAFSPFSDGGVSVYTGHLMGPVLVDGEWQETVLDARYTARMDENVVTREPERLVHQFVYFGKQPMLATEGVVAVIDPAVPGKARAGILASIPAVTAMLEQDFDFVPRSPYTVFMAMQLDASDGYSIKGGVQPDQILFTLKGGGVASLVEKNPAQLPKLTAHEVLHLWQVEHWFDLLGNDHPWVHEGSADALAIELM